METLASEYCIICLDPNDVSKMIPRVCIVAMQARTLLMSTKTPQMCCHSTKGNRLADNVESKYKPTTADGGSQWLEKIT